MLIKLDFFTYFRKIAQTPYFMKILQQERSCCMRTDRQTETWRS